jgi:ankyrin repeat protein
VQVLLENGSDAAGNSDAFTTAMKKGRLDIIKLLIEHGANVNGGKSSPLSCAVKLEHVEMFHFLVTRGLELTDEAYVVAMEEARSEGLDSMIQLLKGIQPNTKGMSVYYEWHRIEKVGVRLRNRD